MITVSVEPQRKLVRAQLSGFLTLAEVADFSRQEQDAVRAMRLGSGEFYLLIDTAGAVIQPQDVVTAFQRLITESPFKAKRIAIARQGSLTRMQAQRVLQIRDNAAVFEDLADAERWLFHDGADNHRSSSPSIFGAVVPHAPESRASEPARAVAIRGRSR